MSLCQGRNSERQEWPHRDRRERQTCPLLSRVDPTQADVQLSAETTHLVIVSNPHLYNIHVTLTTRLKKILFVSSKACLQAACFDFLFSFAKISIIYHQPKWIFENILTSMASNYRHAKL